MNDFPTPPPGGPGRVVFVHAAKGPDSPERQTRRKRMLQQCGLDSAATQSPLFRQVTLMAHEALEDVSSREGISVWPGFCGEDICTANVDYEALRVGSLLRVGEALLLIVQKGKNCGGKCVVSQKTLDCPLSGSWLAAWMIRQGEIRQEDPIHEMLAELEPALAEGGAG